MVSGFTKRSEWLRYFLGMEDTQLPTKLRNDEVIPVVEIAQGGFSVSPTLGTYLDDTVTSTGTDILSAAPNGEYGYLVTAAEMANNGGAGRTVNLRLGHGSAGSTFLLKSFVLGAGGGAGSADILGTVGGKLWVPPYFRLLTTYSAAIAAGQSVGLTLAFYRVPAGVKPY